MNVTGMKQTESSAPVIVIGAGPAGLYAAFQLGLRGHRPVIIDTLAKAGGQCSALYPEGEILDAPGFSAIPAAELTARLEAQLEPFRPLFLRGRRATAVWGSIESGFNVETNTGETITGGAVVYAGGIGAIRPKRLAAQGWRPSARMISAMSRARSQPVVMSPWLAMVRLRLMRRLKPQAAPPVSR